jgi:hypothetical protein
MKLTIASTIMLGAAVAASLMLVPALAPAAPAHGVGPADSVAASLLQRVEMRFSVQKGTYVWRPSPSLPTPRPIRIPLPRPRY